MVTGGGAMGGRMVELEGSGVELKDPGGLALVKTSKESSGSRAGVMVVVTAVGAVAAVGGAEARGIEETRGAAVGDGGCRAM